ncbi:CHAT domain-containing protein [Virgisporangium aurantiacum]|uniref:CHAT domain-containing protein n=1 Tax=Virgisporangium aurantiacum TaxID=175570 RepID=A0A8J3Z2Q6_9ACTN|nr:CHAT domain-containing tetratricopeptide repeat protein [Virgisporangium aurantiacum]GIJ55297.1 CHAT domain-containing protein [Virgisporangium aurantiacum]
MSSDLAEQARAALRSAESDPRQATRSASGILDQARAVGDLAVACVAERALGLAALHARDLDVAMRHLRSAIRHGERAAAPELAAQARMTLAFAMSSRGWSGKALREIERALRDLRGSDRARCVAQRGVIAHQLGRLDAALADYNAALPALRRADDPVWIWRVLSNRGVLYGHRLQLGSALADLTEAARLSDELRLGTSAAFTQQNLGWVNTLAGDLPQALRDLDEAEQRLRGLNAQLGQVLRDRTELLLSMYLAAEARTAAENAATELRRERRLGAVPEVRLLHSRAALLDDDPAVALAQAKQAVREFERQSRPEWAAQARFAVLAARMAGPNCNRVTIAEAARVADALDRTPWTASAAEARVAAAQLALERGRGAEARAHLEQVDPARRRGPAALRARAWYATALLRLSGGNPRGAVRAVRTGLRIVDEHRATLGATDLLAHTAAQRTELAQLGLRIAMTRGNPRAVFEWAERGRASLFLIRPVRPPEDPPLAAALAELRLAVNEAAEQRGAGRNPARALARQIALERQIRDYCRRQPGQAELSDPTPLDALIDRLGRAALLEFVELDGVLSMVALIDGRARLHRLGPAEPVHDLLDRVAFGLHRLARQRSGAAGRAAAVAMLRDAANRLDHLLLQPVRDALGDAVTGAPVVLVPTGRLQSLPWSILPTCAGRPVTVAPSATSWFLARTRSYQATGSVAVVAGPQLPGARREAESVAAIYSTVALVDASATAEATAAALTKADLAHLAMHGRLSPDNPLFSSLQLADGPLMVYDLEQLPRVPPTVVLAACDSGRHVVYAGDELLGLAATFLAKGAQQLVASVVPVPDAATAPLMVEFHRRLAAGLAPATALAQAQQSVGLSTDEAGGAELAAAAGFVCVGAGLPR